MSDDPLDPLRRTGLLPIARGVSAADLEWLRTEVMKFVAAVKRGRQQHA